ncbi:hypothetical protein [Rhodanobacter geophilus]|uniref:Uncharacterized protein n=1 Tax=Rhodanobacter geophilus TaxID=3162488 RepID=A0ABV3QQL3_9GAMM
MKPTVRRAAMRVLDLARRKLLFHESVARGAIPPVARADRCAQGGPYVFSHYPNPQWLAASRNLRCSPAQTATASLAH